MRIVAVDAAVDDARAERCLALALGRAPDRLLLFRAAAAVAQKSAARDIAQRDERFLDAAAAWLLDAPRSGDVDAVPSRARMKVPLIELSVAVDVVDRAPLVTLPQAVEMMGAHLCIAVHDAAAFDGDEVENAALWIVGGGDEFRLEPKKGRLVLTPGDVGIAVVDTQFGSGGGPEIKVARLDLDGGVVESERVSLSGQHTRMQVQG